MLLISHTFTGAVIGQKLGDPVLISLIAFLSHFVLDYIPHWNYDIPKQIRLKEFIKILPDILPAVLIYMVFISLYPDKWLYITLGVGFSILPDFLMLAKFFPVVKKYFNWLNQLHEKLQGHLHFKKKNETLVGLYIQIYYIGMLMIIMILF